MNEKQQFPRIVMMCLAILILSAVGCGGGGSAAVVPPPPPPPVPSATITATPTTVIVGDQVALTWSSTNSTACNASANPAQADWTGAKPISGSGTVTPSSVNPTTYSLTCSGPGGTSPNTGTKVTVNAPPPTPTATSVAPAFAWLDQASFTPISLTLNGSGFVVGDQVSATVNGLNLPIFSPVLVNSSRIDFGIGIDSHHFVQGWGTVMDCRSQASGCSNAVSFGFSGNGMNQMAVSSTGMLYGLVTSSGLLTVQDNAVHRFNPDGTVSGQFFLGTGAMAIALDETSQMLVIPFCSINGCSTSFYDVNLDTNPGRIGNASVSGSIAGVAAKNGFGCVAQPNEGVVSGFPVAPQSTTAVSTQPGQAGTKPWIVAMATFGSGATAKLDCISFAKGNGQLTKFTLSGMTPDGSPLTLPGLGAADHYQLVVFDSGSAAGDAVLLDEEQGILVFVNLATMQELRRVPLPKSATQGTLTLAADAANAAAVVTTADVSTNTLTFTRVPVAAGASIQLTATSPVFPAGFVVNAVGNKIAIFAAGQVEVLANQ